MCLLPLRPPPLPRPPPLSASLSYLVHAPRYASTTHMAVGGGNNSISNKHCQISQYVLVSLLHGCLLLCAEGETLHDHGTAKSCLHDAPSASCHK